MGSTPNRLVGDREDAGLLLDPGATHPTRNGQAKYVTGVGFRFFEEGVERGLDLAPVISFDAILVDVSGSVVCSRDGTVVARNP